MSSFFPDFISFRSASNRMFQGSVLPLVFQFPKAQGIEDVTRTSFPLISCAEKTAEAGLGVITFVAALHKKHHILLAGKRVCFVLLKNA